MATSNANTKSCKSKKCPKCGEVRSVDCFSVCRSRRDGLQSSCKSCKSKAYQANRDAVLSKQKQYQTENPEHVRQLRKANYERNKAVIAKKQAEYYQKNKDRYAAYNRSYRLQNQDSIKQKKNAHYRKNKESILKKNRQWLADNAEHVKASKREYGIKNRARLSEYKKNKYNEDIEYRMTVCLRSRMRIGLLGITKKGSAVKNLGCSTEFARSYIESLWAPGMTWDNWSLDGWHIDHAMPLKADIVDLQNEFHQRALCHFSNLRPEWGSENMSRKNTSYTREAKANFLRLVEHYEHIATQT